MVVYFRAKVEKLVTTNYSDLKKNDNIFLNENISFLMKTADDNTMLSKEDEVKIIDTLFSWTN
ncbi:hypothetical protein ACW95P_00105 [Candidatus Mycoplasma pogonae]